jgi:hypothetical protein
MYREMLKREVEKVQQGLDPICVTRDPDLAMIDTGLAENLDRAAYREIYRVADQNRSDAAPDRRPEYQRYETIPTPRKVD